VDLAEMKILLGVAYELGEKCRKKEYKLAEI
jgi:hypothetical protein